MFILPMIYLSLRYWIVGLLHSCLQRSFSNLCSFFSRTLSYRPTITILVLLLAFSFLSSCSSHVNLLELISHNNVYCFMKLFNVIFVWILQESSASLRQFSSETFKKNRNHCFIKLSNLIFVLILQEPSACWRLCSSEFLFQKLEISFSLNCPI